MHISITYCIINMASYLVLDILALLYNFIYKGFMDSKEST
jgi:hypothetical protein